MRKTRSLNKKLLSKKGAALSKRYESFVGNNACNFAHCELLSIFFFRINIRIKNFEILVFLQNPIKKIKIDRFEEGTIMLKKKKKILPRILRSIVTRIFVATQEMDSPNKSSNALQGQMKNENTTRWKFHFPSTRQGNCIQWRNYPIQLIILIEFYRFSSKGQSMILLIDFKLFVSASFAKMRFSRVLVSLSF